MEAPVRPPVAVRGRVSAELVLVGVCLALAAVSLLLPAALSFDPWAWLVWGREAGRLTLDTTGGPSWKPLPVLVTTVLAPFGDLAVPLWMVISRAGAFFAVAATYRLASRVAGTMAGVIAAGLLLLTPDGDPRFLRLVGEGHVAPWSVAFILFAVDSHLDRRWSRVLVLGWCAALLRPEAWPFLGLYAVWLWSRHPGERRLVAATLASIPVLWFGGDWWGSGDPLHGADAAQVAADDSVGARLVQSLEVLVAVVVAPAWAAAGAGVVSARRRGERAVLAVTGGALGWAAVVVIMATVLGYAALSRFFLPVAAVVCVLAGVGVVRSFLALRRHGQLVLAGCLAVLAVGLAVPRIAGVVPVLDAVGERGRIEDDLDRVIELAGGAEVLAACGEVAVEGTGLLRTSVAWKLDLPLHLVPRQLLDGSGGMLLRAGGKRDRTLAHLPHVTELARTPEWVANAARCPAGAPES